MRAISLIAISTLVPGLAITHGNRLEDLVERAIEARTLGVLGEPRVNVVRLNVALDHDLGAPRP